LLEDCPYTVITGAESNDFSISKKIKLNVY
jgi:hypothetical protein